MAEVKGNEKVTKSSVFNLNEAGVTQVVRGASYRSGRQRLENTKREEEKPERSSSYMYRRRSCEAQLAHQQDVASDERLNVKSLPNVPQAICRVGGYSFRNSGK